MDVLLCFLGVIVVLKFIHLVKRICSGKATFWRSIPEFAVLAVVLTVCSLY